MEFEKSRKSIHTFFQLRRLLEKKLSRKVLEKALKAHYVQDNENQMPPRIHNLVKLAEKTRIALSEER